MRNLPGFIFGLLAAINIIGCSNENENGSKPEITISTIGGHEVSSTSDIVVSKPMPITVTGTFKNINNNYIYVMQTSQGENEVYHIQPVPMINELGSTFEASVWFGEDVGPGDGKVFSLVAILSKEKIHLKDGDNPVSGIPEHIIRTPKIRVSRNDEQ